MRGVPRWRQVVYIGALIAGVPCVADAADVRLCPDELSIHRDGSVEFERIRSRDVGAIKRHLLTYKHHHPDCIVDVAVAERVDMRSIGNVLLAIQESGLLGPGALIVPRTIPN
jgi:hypothetical protein